MYKVVSVTDTIPQDAIQRIFPFLSQNDVANMFKVSKLFHENVKEFLRYSEQIHTTFNEKLKTALPREISPLMESLDKNIKDIGLGNWRPERAPYPQKPSPPTLTVEFLQANVGEKCNNIAYTIAYFSTNSRNHGRLMAADAHSLFCTLLRDSQATLLQKKWAAETLCNLSKNDANHGRLMDAGAHIRFCTLLMDPHAFLSAKKNAADALFILCNNDANHETLINDGVDILLSRCLYDENSSPEAKADAAQFSEAKEYVAHLLSMLCANEAHHEELITGMATRLSLCLNDGNSSPEAKVWAAHLLYMLCANQNNHEALVEKKVHISLSSSLNNPLTTDESKRTTAKTLFHLSKNPAILQRLVEDNVIDLLTRFINDPTARSEVVAASLSGSKAQETPLDEANRYAKLARKKLSDSTTGASNSRSPKRQKRQ